MDNTLLLNGLDTTRAEVGRERMKEVCFTRRRQKKKRKARSTYSFTRGVHTPPRRQPLTTIETKQESAQEKTRVSFLRSSIFQRQSLTLEDGRRCIQNAKKEEREESRGSHGERRPTDCMQAIFFLHAHASSPSTDAKPKRTRTCRHLAYTYVDTTAIGC